MQDLLSLQVLLNLMSTAALVTNAEGRIVLANMQVEGMFGYSRNELVGQSLNVLLPERFRQRHGAHCLAYMSNRQRRSMGDGMELLALRKDGTELPIEIILSGLDVSDDPLVLSMIREASERQKGE